MTCPTRPLRRWVVSILLALVAMASAAATFTVNTTADDPPSADDCRTPDARCSLRAAILAANDVAGGDRIHFALSPADPGFDSGYWTIQPAGLLPAIEGPTLIDGITQDGSACAGAPGAPHRLLVRLDGRGVPPTAGADAGLHVRLGEGSTIRGLSITRFPDAAIQVDAATDVLCNYLGLDPGGAAAGNRDGVLMNGSGHHVGGRSDAERNVIAANRQANVYVSNADDVLIEGNYIGTDPTGTEVREPNGTGVLLLQGTAARIGGGAARAGNLISGNNLGIEVGRQFGDHRSVYFEAVIQGNRIGTDSTGLLALPNQQEGIVVVSPDTLIGGNRAGMGNVIAASGRAGIRIESDTKRAQVLGNRVGVSVDGSPLGNDGDGVFNAGPIATLGGPGAAANIIAHNGGAGVSIRNRPETAGASALILHNRIHSNGRLGIDVAADLGLDDVTANDSREATNPRALNFPVVSTARSDGRTTRVTGTLNSFPDTPFELRFYASAEADPSGHGEGERLLGNLSVTTNSAGNAAFTAATLPVATPADWFVSATSTHASGERYTSEFGPVVGATRTSPIGRLVLPVVVGLLGVLALLSLLLRRP